MKAVTLVTGNPDKLIELRQVFPAHIELTHAKLDISEIQGEADPHTIVADKIRQAYRQTGGPVIVEDVSAELACLQGLPGPFIKFFEQRLGNDALWQLARHHEDRRAAIRCSMGWYDGKTLHIADGIVEGDIVAPRGENGFGFDKVFQPDGHDRTVAEMSTDEKNALSWRGLAARALADKLYPNRR